MYLDSWNLCKEKNGLDYNKEVYKHYYDSPGIPVYCKLNS